MKDLPARDRAIVCGLFFSKFDIEGINVLGFMSYREAFNVLGLALGIKPASIKNYRDELDPLFPNPRQGWHKRPLREYCKTIYDRFGGLDIQAMSGLIIKMTGINLDISDTESDRASTEKASDVFAKRLITGKAAENYFIQNFSKEPCFQSVGLTDVTQTGCGFDFRLKSKHADEYLAVEVKGLRSLTGAISLTNKEHSVASEFGQRYFLYIVKNFDEIPFAKNIQNPLQAGIGFKRVEQKIIQISWSARL